MNHAQIPVVKDIVLLGGGHSHVQVLKRFGMRPLPGVRLTTICRDIHTPYSGMLPGLVAGHYTFDEAHIDLGPLAQFAGARLYHDEAVALDLAGRRVKCKGRPPVPYDVLSINIGSTPRVEHIEGALDRVVPVKPINNFTQRWEALQERVLAAAERLNIGVVGAGAGGVELTLSIQFALRNLLRRSGREALLPKFHLFSSGAILPTHNGKVQKRFTQILKARDVDVHTGGRVEAVEPETVRLSSGEKLAVDEVLWVTEAGAAPWLAESGLAVDDSGFVLIDDTLQSTSHPGIFAAGDVAASVRHPREKAGVFAVRQGPPLAQNLRRAILGQPLRPFVPQAKFLSLISTGDRSAVASRGNWSVAGKWVWRWKDWIDRRFMEKFNELPDMATENGPEIPAGLAPAEARKEISAIAMRCGGCGAKVGATVLSRVLARLHPRQRDDVLIGLSSPDDAAVSEVPAGKLVVQTVDSFRTFLDDPYVFGKIAANHSLGDIFSMGAEAQTALAIATVPFAVEEKVEETLQQMLQGAVEVLDAAGASLVGGHTSEGRELTLGFALNGLIDRDHVLRKGGMQPGQAIVLTKALGTGTLFAAQMRLKAKGRWIDGAVEMMLQSNQEAARCLRRHGATACTDVTGFGLLGHLVEMTKASATDVRLQLGEVPLLDGALETSAAGILSSLQPQNVRLRRALANAAEFTSDGRYPLLFDPQTAGGLLATLPAENAGACVAELRQLQYTRAAVVGTVEKRGDGSEPVQLE